MGCHTQMRQRSLPAHESCLVTLVALYLCSHALLANAAQQLPALLLNEADAVDRLHAAAHHIGGKGAQGLLRSSMGASVLKYI